MQFEFFAIKFVFTVDWSTNSIVLQNDIHVRFTMIHIWKSDLKQNIDSGKFMQLAINCKYTCVHGFDWSTDPILLKIDVHVRFTRIQFWKSDLKKKYYW